MALVAQAAEMPTDGKDQSSEHMKATGTAASNAVPKSTVLISISLLHNVFANI